MILNEDHQEDGIYVIEHYGKQGMKWGVRKQSIKSNAYKSVRENQRRRDNRIERLGGKKGGGYTGVAKAKIKSMSPEQKKKLKKAAIGIGVAAGISATAIVAGRAFAKTRIKEVPFKTIPRTSPEHQKFVSDFMKKQFRLNAAANGDLKKLYNMNDTPIHMREYLPILPGQR